MIPPERDLRPSGTTRCIQSRYGFNPHHLMLADACEFFIGQGCKVGLGGHLMGQKVTEQVAEMRSLPAGIDQRSPARHPDWLGPDDLSLKIQEIREATDYQIPIQLKLGAARVYDDVRMAAKCGPDIIYLDGAEGGTGAGPHIATEETGIPLMAAIPEARRALEDVGLADEIDLVVAGGIRNGGDVAKCLALGAKAVAIGHSALMALNCNKEIPGVTDYEGTVGVPAGQCYHCHTGRCPVGHHDAGSRSCASGSSSRRPPSASTTSCTRSRSRCRCSRARAARPTSTRSSPRTSRALTVEAAAMAKVPLAGTNYIPGVTEERDARARSSACSISTWRTSIDDPPPARARGGGATMSDDEHASTRAREDRVDRRRVPRGPALPLPGGHLARRGHRPRGGDARARTSTGSRTSTLLEEDGMPAVFDRYSNSFLKIYFDDPRGPRGRDRAQGADDAPAVGQLLRHPAEGRSTRSSRSPSSARGSRARGPSAPTGSRPCSRAGRSPPGTDLDHVVGCGAEGRSAPGRTAGFALSVAVCGEVHVVLRRSRPGPAQPSPNRSTGRAYDCGRTIPLRRRQRSR